MMMEYQLLTWREERQAEFIGELTGKLSRDGDPPLFLDSYRAATTLGDSSADAKKQFDIAVLRAVEGGAEWGPEQGAAVDDFVLGKGESPL